MQTQEHSDNKILNDQAENDDWTGLKVLFTYKYSFLDTLSVLFCICLFIHPLLAHARNKTTFLEDVSFDLR